MPTFLIETSLELSLTQKQIDRNKDNLQEYIEELYIERANKDAVIKVTKLKS